MSFRQRFPDEASLQRAIDVKLATFVAAVAAQAGPLEAEYLQKRRARRWGIGCIVVALFGITFLLEWVAEAPLGILWVVGILLATLALGLCGWRLVRGSAAAISAFNEAFTQATMPLVFDLLSLSGERLTPSEAHLRQVKDLLDHAELITEPRNRLRIDDMYACTVADRSLLLAELDVKHVTGSGKRRRVKKIFKGYFVTLELPRSLQGKTFVSTEGDERGFAHKDFWDTVTGNSVRETELEWNEFESLLHVASDDPTEARYILTPDFMQDLYAWWVKKEEHIRISFLDNRMYLLFPDNGIRIGLTVPEISAQEVRRYLESVAVPMLHVVHLVEDVRARFRY